MLFNTLISARNGYRFFDHPFGEIGEFNFDIKII